MTRACARNVLRLAAAQALTGANGAVIFATGSIIGATLAPSISLATVPLSLYVLGMAAGTLPTGAISRAYGRKVAFMIGTTFGTLTGLLGAFAVLHASFWLFCCATFLGGLYGAVAQSYRFAAADGASAAFRPKAVSWVMAGGVFAGFHRSATRAMDHGHLAALHVRVFLRDAGRGRAGRDGDSLPASMRRGRRRPICMAAVRCSRSCAQPRFIAAALCGVIAYPIMNLVMTSAPLAMKMCGLTVSRFQFRHPVAHGGDVRPELLHGLADRALRRAAHRRARARRSKPSPPSSVSPGSPRRISGRP